MLYGAGTHRGLRILVGTPLLLIHTYTVLHSSVVDTVINVCAKESCFQAANCNKTRPARKQALEPRQAQTGHSMSEACTQLPHPICRPLFMRRCPSSAPLQVTQATPCKSAAASGHACCPWSAPWLSSTYLRNRQQAAQLQQHPTASQTPATFRWPS